MAQQPPIAIDDIRVLIDISGSMKRTDPNNLRAPALRLFVSLLPPGSQGGVWTFGQWVNMLIKPSPVDSQWKNTARSAAGMINSHGMFTNIEDALQRATWDWSRPDPAYRRSLILLTDGLVDVSDDPAKNTTSRRHILENLLPRLRMAGVKIHTIALSNESDSELLRQLAASTGGWFETVEKADGLEKIFFRMFEKVAATNTLPLSNNRVTIDGSIKEATFLVFRESEEKETTISTPSSSVFSQTDHPKEMQWHKESRYDLITVKNPEAGDWQINAKMDPDNRVMVITDLQLKSTTLPNDLVANKAIPFQVRLEQKGNTIQRREFLRFVSVALTQTSMKEEKWQWELHDNGEAPDEVANDGIYTGLLGESLIEGEHEIEVKVDGTTFKRNSRQLIKVHDQPVVASVSPMDEGHVVISIVPYQSLINADDMHLEVLHSNPSGELKELELARVSPSEWRVVLDEHESPGEHSIKIHLTGTSPDGEAIDTTIAPMFFNIGAIEMPRLDNHEEASPADDLTNEPAIDRVDQNVNWLFVGLRMLVLNIFMIAFVFGGYKLWPMIKKRLIPNPCEYLANAK